LKLLFTLLLLISVSFANDATIEVIKKVESLPTLALEDASIGDDDIFKLRFFKALRADLNVLSLFNVDRHYNQIDFDDSNVLVSNKDMSYVLRYKTFFSDDGILNVEVKLINNSNNVLLKRYTINRKNIYVFVAHTIAYDINKFMGEPSVEWMKKRVLFSRILGSKKSEIVIADYTLSYQHTVLKGGLNLFPKWANEKQSAFYYSSLSSAKPTLKYLNTRTGKSKVVLSSDGMMVCSDVSADGNMLLLTMAPHGQPDIYLYKVSTRQYKKVTSYRGIDVNGQFIDNDTIAFISNRLGYPNVFSKKIKSSSVEQMVYYGNSNSACGSSGEYIVYKSRESSNAFSRNTFNLHLISTRTDFIRRLTATGVNEFPRFSKDGDAILFIKNYKSQSSLGIIRLNHNKNYLFPLKYGKIQSIDW
jgi:TolB protein